MRVFFHLNLKSGTKTGLLLYYLIRSVAGVEWIPMHYTFFLPSGLIDSILRHLPQGYDVACMS